jgi:histidinol-phosphatase
MSEFLEAALQAAHEAESVILKHFEAGVSAEKKPDESPVTIADKEAERIIKEYLLGRFPEHGFLGEETGETNPDSSYTWIVDPIDGTRNYSRGVPIFGTQIALMHDDELILGVSNAPALKELAYAEKGKGAQLNGRSLRVSKVERLEDAFVSFGGIKSFQKDKTTENLLSLLADSWGDHGFGDFWSYTLVAQGVMDVMVNARINVWDVAAAKVIIEEAGGTVTDLSGNPISKKTASAVGTNGHLHGKVLRYFE